MVRVCAVMLVPVVVAKVVVALSLKVVTRATISEGEVGCQSLHRFRRRVVAQQATGVVASKRVH